MGKRTIYLRRTPRPRDLHKMRRRTIAIPDDETAYVLYEPWTHASLRKVAKQIGRVRVHQKQSVDQVRKHIAKHDKENQFGLK